MIRIGLLSILVHGVVGFQPAAAQAPDATDGLIGRRVRARACGEGVPQYADHRSCRRTVGDLLEATPDAFHIRVNADSVATIPRASVRDFDVSAGLGRRGGKGALIGGGVGLGLGLLAAVAVASEGADDAVGAFVLGVPLVTGALGAGVGFAVGSMSRSEQWVRVPESDVAVLPMVGPASVGLAVRVGFGQ